MIRDLRGGSLVEYIVLVVVIVALIGAALMTLSGTIVRKIISVYHDMGD